jgi:MoaA/NifB/PqqE/SkfB family radical SAM enzyme
MRSSTLFHISKEAIKYNIAGIFPRISDRLQKNPLFIRVRLTYKCSGSCKSCTLWNNETDRELSTEEWKDIFLKFKQENVWNISFTGGDIFFRKDIFELMRFSNGLGIKTSCMINGYSVNEHNAQQLMESNISSVCLSLDDLTSKFDSLRGVEDAAAKVQNSIKYLQNNSNGHTSIILAATLMRDTIGSAKKVVNFAIQNNLQIGFNLIHFTHFYTDTNFSREQYELKRTEKDDLKDLILWLVKKRKKYPEIIPKFTSLEWVLKYFNDYHQEQTPCYQPMSKLCLEPNGDVRGCCSMDVVGNLVKQDMETVLNSDGYNSQVLKALTKTCPGCSCGYTRNLDFNIGLRIREILLKSGIANFDV